MNGPAGAPHVLVLPRTVVCLGNSKPAPKVPLTALKEMLATNENVDRSAWAARTLFHQTPSRKGPSLITLHLRVLK